MSNVVNGLNGLTRRALVLSSALYGWRLCEHPVIANPTGGVVAQGGASFSTAGSVETITTSGNAYINWGSFNIASGETTTFAEPSSSSIVWNNVGGNSPSQINGTLNANGLVILQNQAGITVGGQAAITAHGLILTTAPIAPPDLSSGGPWSFNTLPPTAQIINYGKINTIGGGSAFLIANDIENKGTISAPSGKIGLYAGEQVLVSLSPDGRALSAAVTLPQGSVDNEGNLTADGGTVVAQAQVVNQNGLIQANSVQDVNGTIELVASDSVNLGANSVISATGDSTSPTASVGGNVTISAVNTFSDNAGSTINVSGATQGGNGGQIEISAPQMASLQSTIDGQAVAGSAGAGLSIDTGNILLNSDGAPVAGDLVLNVNALSSGLSQINLQAANNIELSSLLDLTPESDVINSVSLLAGNTVNVDSGAGIEVDGGRITLNAPTINQNGTLQANSVGPYNGVVEINAGQSLNLGADSVISANGDPTDSSGGPGGFVVLQSANTYADTPTSIINVTGQNGGQNGIIEILGTGNVQSTIGKNFALLENPFDLTLSYNPTAVSSTTSPNFNIADLSVYSQIDLHTLDNIELSVPWTLNDSASQAWLSLQAVNSVILDDGSDIYGGNNWNVNLVAGTGFIPTTSQPTPNPDSDGIYLNGSAYVLTQNGNINFWAANEVQVGYGGYTDEKGSSGITTLGGGNISVTTLYGDVNAGSNPLGFVYQDSDSAPYYTVANDTIDTASLGGISTAAGGNVTINAGGNVFSYAPAGNSSSSLSADDGGSGAFGPEAGNVTITAGGSVYGNYVLANGAGSITAGQNIGAAAGNPFALSLVDGNWTVNAPDGTIHLQEVRNPNGVFDNLDQASPGYHLFDYSPQAYVDLTAYAVILTGAAVPRPDGAVPVLYPPILDITAGAGGVTLDANVTLFPSPDQNLEITTTDGGNLTAPVDLASVIELYMSDSSQGQWKSSVSFGTDDHGTTPPQLYNYNPVLINISGSMENLNLITDKATELTVAGNMTDSGFSGENLENSDLTSITVDGQIYNQPAYAFVDNIDIPSLPADVLPLGFANAWNTVFTLALDPTAIADLQVPSNLQPSQWATYALENTSYFGDKVVNGQVVSDNPGFVYNTVTEQLGFGGQMNSQVQSELAQPLTVLVFGSDGLPETYTSGGKTYFKTTQINWVAPAQIPLLFGNGSGTLFTESQADPSPASASLGYRVGGPGLFEINAGSISLGNSDGILSTGVQDPEGGFARYNNLASITPEGASVDVTVSGDLDMLTSTIAALGGGDVIVTSTGGSMDLGTESVDNETRQVGFGIFTSGGGDVNVTALDDINIDGSRIATYNGGNIFVESYTGDVNVGSGGDSFTGVEVAFVNPANGKADYYAEDVYGSGILADTLVPAPKGQILPPDAAALPGNITVETPEGNITAGLGGITQQALDGNLAAGPTIDLTAGTAASGTVGEPGYSPGYVGNIDLGQSGVIGGSVTATANGNISGLVISRQNSTINAAQNFSGSVLAGGSADVGAGGSVAGVIVGVGGASVSGGNVSASVLGQNVSVNGGASQSTLGSSAAATSTSQSASQQANSQAQQQVAANSADDDDNDNKNKKKPALLQHIKRVTVILPKSV
jgi:filamentous hemagglutinin family protein